MEVPTPNESHRAVMIEEDLKARVLSFKTRLSNCSDPKMQYELLRELQETNPDMYYRFIQKYTSLALYIFCKNDRVLNSFGNLDEILNKK